MQNAKCKMQNANAKINLIEHAADKNNVGEHFFAERDY
jgi:hypothetical protein